MSEVANIYDNGPISPIAKIMENLSIWTLAKWQHYKIKNIEPLPRSTPTVVEMVVLSGAAVLGPYGTIAKIGIPILRPNVLELLHLRWEPIDDVEGVLWEQASVGRFTPMSVHARVTLNSATRDPYLAGTTFWILGRDREMALEVRNPNPTIIPQARFAFFGYRYMLEALSSSDSSRCMDGQLKSTWLPAEGF